MRQTAERCMTVRSAGLTAEQEQMWKEGYEYLINAALRKALSQTDKFEDDGCCRQLYNDVDRDFAVVYADDRKSVELSKDALKKQVPEFDIDNWKRLNPQHSHDNTKAEDEHEKILKDETKKFFDSTLGENPNLRKMISQCAHQGGITAEIQSPFTVTIPGLPKMREPTLPLLGETSSFGLEEIICDFPRSPLLVTRQGGDIVLAVDVGVVAKRLGDEKPFRALKVGITARFEEALTQNGIPDVKVTDLRYEELDDPRTLRLDRPTV